MEQKVSAARRFRCSPIFFGEIRTLQLRQVRGLQRQLMERELGAARRTSGGSGRTARSDVVSSNLEEACRDGSACAPSD